MDSGYYALSTALIARTQALDTIANNPGKLQHDRLPGGAERVQLRSNGERERVELAVESGN